MSTTPNDLGAASAVESETRARPLAPTRPFVWSVRRELWEHRSLFLAPTAVAAIVLLGFLISTFTLSARMHAASALDPAKQHILVTRPYDVIAGLILLTTFLVGIFYCLEALHAERRDRSILFWKSLPVSDRVAVLSKACIPLVVLPLVAYVLIVSCQVIMLFVSTLALLGDARSLAILWTRSPLVQLSVALLYCLIALTLWVAPVYAWFLLVSAWARRAAFLWALLPPLVVSAFEAVAFRGTRLAPLLVERLTGWFPRACIVHEHGGGPTNPLSDLTPGRYLSTPALWVGLAFAVLFLYGAIRLRRNRQPI